MKFAADFDPRRRLSRNTRPFAVTVTEVERYDDDADIKDLREFSNRSLDVSINEGM